MKTIQVSDEVYDFIQAEAAAKETTDSNYVRSLIVSRACLAAVRRVNELPVGKTFVVPDLFGADWTKFHPFAGSIGKTFCDMVSNGTILNVKLLENPGSSGKATYERL
ncbi:MAG: DUF1413 domain-containing protein [Selenomonas sp.]|jgi:hypothetical protein|nr:DUF1413 domain-containing protein [Selenomonas sp.]